MGDRIESLNRELQEFSISVDDDFLIKMNELCIVHGLDPESMVDSWVAYATTKNCSPSLDSLGQFEREELSKKANKTKKSIGSKKRGACDIDIELNGSLSDQHTPEQRKSSNTSRSPRLPFSPNSYSPFPSTPSSKYASRKASGGISSSFGCTENMVWANEHVSACTIAPYDKESALSCAYTYMFEKFRDYASVLNDMIDDLAELLQKQLDIPEWSPIQLPALEPVPMVGRVCSDGGVKLNIQSILLEGSLETSSGHILPLDVEHMEKFSFFPGQIIAGLGMNSLGKKIVMKELYTDLSPSFSEEVPDFGEITDFISVIVAAGPYTTSDCLSYEPLFDLIKYIKANKPHVCILCGPFVDVKHEDIQRGSFPETYQEMFHRLMQTISTDLEQLNTKIVMVPSMRDVHHYPVYPTPPYETTTLFKNFYFASDPCMLKINGVVFGITATDILLHLGKEEINFPPQSSDRLGRLCGHLLNQRKFYPLYPSSEEVNIDYVHFEMFAQMPVLPHVLIVPSDFKNFIKDVNGCCCVNPERLAKYSSGGSFARMRINAVDPKIYSGSIIDCVQAEIVKI